MSKQPDPTTPLDPFGAWRATRDAYMEAWSKTMLDLVNSEAYTQATARMLDSYLTASAPMRKLLEGTMTQVLKQLNMPARAEVTSLAERLTNIEVRLDDLDAKLDDLIRQRGARPSAQSGAAPRRAASRNSRNGR